MTAKIAYIIGSSFGALGVIIGAFGAHKFQKILEATGYGEQFETGNKYLFYHTFAILFCGILYSTGQLKNIQWPVLLFTVGILLFSGSLYTMGLTGIRKLGMITPIGGACFIAGWGMLIYRVINA